MPIGVDHVVTIDDAARVASSLPDVTEGARYGNRTWFVNKNAFVWERPFSKADIKRFGDTTQPEGPIIAVATADLADKVALLAIHPVSLFTIAHFAAFPVVLVHLQVITLADLRKVVIDGWLTGAPQAIAQAFLEAEAGHSAD